jgi:bisphosphoglycerate-dependent phosphoglycerate mutase
MKIIDKRSLTNEAMKIMKEEITDYIRKQNTKLSLDRKEFLYGGGIGAGKSAALAQYVEQQLKVIRNNNEND